MDEENSKKDPERQAAALEDCRAVDRGETAAKDTSPRTAGPSIKGTGEPIAGGNGNPSGRDSSERRAPIEIERDILALPLAEQLRLAADLLDGAAVAEDSRKANLHRIAYAIVNRAAADLAPMVMR